MLCIFLGIKSVQVDLDSEQVVVETTLPSSKVQSLLESTGKRAVLLGYGKGMGYKYCYLSGELWG